tara:strand:- start:11938 stop:13569 length:1632 start_codon:yes stop_codon:yes gene_type:complete
MLATHSVNIAFKPEAKVTALELSSKGDFAVWAESDGRLFIAKEVKGVLTPTGSWNAPAFIRSVVLRKGQIFVLDDEVGLTCLDSKGEIIWQIEIGAGGFDLHELPNHLALIDGLGRLHLVNYDGTEVVLTQKYHDILRISTVGDYLILAYESGEVQALKNGNCLWSRPARGQTGESITCLGCDKNNHLVLGREGYALVGGEEEALEIEIWDIDQQRLLHRVDVKSRLLHTIPSTEGFLCGFDDGEVVEVLSGDSYRFESRLSCGYPIQKLLFCRQSIVASAWFYIYGRNADGAEWKIEHQGMPNMLVASHDGSVCLFAGEDQNDWTDVEPIGIFSLSEEIFEIDSSELTLWFEKSNEVESLTAEELYRVDDEMNSFFSQEELESMESSQPAGVAVEALHSALEGTFIASQDVAEDGSLDIDTDELLAELDDAMAKMALIPSDDLIDELNTEVGEIIVPRAVTGDDQNLNADEDGSAIVTLDGTQSYDPQGRIKTWSWIESSGKEIASSAKVRVRISRGHHTFELRICDRDGQWSSDSIHINID